MPFYSVKSEVSLISRFFKNKILLFFFLTACLSFSTFPKKTFANPSKHNGHTEYSQIVWDFLETLCDFGPRYPGSPGYKKTQRLIRETGLKFAGSVDLKPFYPLLSDSGKGMEFLNIVLKFKGEEVGKPLLIGAHYDTRPFADEEEGPDKKKQPILGANDGGSGVALLLGLASWLADHPPKRPVHLVFFDGEDYGAKGSGKILMGSIHMASEFLMAEEEEKPRSVLILDMLGDEELEIYKENFSLKSAPDLVNDLFSIALQNNFSQFKDKSKYTIFDDHYPFAKIGVPSAVLIDFDYPHWHKLSDTLDKCSIESLNAVFSVVTEWLKTL